MALPISPGSALSRGKVTKFPPRINGYVLCGIATDRFFFVDVYEVAVLAHASDLPQQVCCPATNYVWGVQKPLILAVKLLRASTIKDLLAQFSKSLAKRSTPQKSTDALCESAASLSFAAGALPKGALVTLTLRRDESLELSCDGASTSVQDGELASGFFRTFFGDKPTTPALVADMEARLWSAIAEAQKIRPALREPQVAVSSTAQPEDQAEKTAPTEDWTVLPEKGRKGEDADRTSTSGLSGRPRADDERSCGSDGHAASEASFVTAADGGLELPGKDISRYDTGLEVLQGSSEGRLVTMDASTEASVDVPGTQTSTVSSIDQEAPPRPLLASVTVDVSRQVRNPPRWRRRFVAVIAAAAVAIAAVVYLRRAARSGWLRRQGIAISASSSSLAGSISQQPAESCAA
eukprot:TRINITY_DN10163_c0_g1_i2.p1 TRINITY_DN10163_c0_g1~~TRINITY_DN10163_c0_g1_i2.p1  ORF type:complete len:408 (-),score=61.95 TRINITY_DN10163_c0_g1_i2:445-1668(-)